MTPIVGHEPAAAALLGAAASGSLHHAWLLAGAEGIGKASFAGAVALRLLAEAASPDGLPPGLGVAHDHPARALMLAGSHPDFRLLRRLPKDTDKPDEDLARSITIAQVRSLGAMFATAPALGSRRVVVVDAIDDLERGGANALLKNLEEPPAGTVFLLVSHAPGRLLPTIRSRCRLLRFEPLAADEVAQVIRRAQPDLHDDEVTTLSTASGGSPGRGLRYAGLDVAALDAALAAIAQDGDPGNARRSQLARTLGAKAAHPRYELFLERTTGFLAAEARRRSGAALAVALDAHAAARDLAGAALGLSLDAAATVFEMAGIVAGLHTGLHRDQPSPARR
ncbi:DNA polymerase III subunit delta' [Sphingomonas bacterium]|uniref:DNA polymerase III subunit delta' n=1 Tax=Sphingomonas bacterium TaxID=1895847 RepID=UPI001576D85A|nr:DNA polymerase III subunit delta' [Sphingomonas bacterium]